MGWSVSIDSIMDWAPQVDKVIVTCPGTPALKRMACVRTCAKDTVMGFRESNIANCET